MRGTKREKRPGVWELRVYIGRDPVTRSPKQVSKTVHGGARVAEAALRDLIDQQAPSRTDGVGATVGQLLDSWLTECERVDLSPTTIRTYKAQIEKTIRPRLGNLPLNRLTAKHLDDLYRSMKEAGRSPKTIRNHHAIMSSALHQAVRWGWVRSNVAELAKRPKQRAKKVNAPSVEDVRAVVEAAEDRDPRLAAFLMFAALTGMRRGEVCGLRWTAVDLDRGEVEVSRSVICVEGGLAEKSTKTDRERRIALDEVGVAQLHQHRARLEQWSDEALIPILEDAYVFSPEIDGSRPFRPDNVTKFFERVRKPLGMEHVRLQDLRHFTATQLVGAGVDVRTVAGRLGHTDPSLTLRVYSHVIEERDRAAAAILGNALKPGATP